MIEHQAAAYQKFAITPLVDVNYAYHLDAAST
jgi:hypothetical protein